MLRYGLAKVLGGDGVEPLRAWWQGLGRPGRIAVVTASAFVLVVGIGATADDPRELASTDATATTASPATVPPPTVPPTTTTTLPPLPAGDDTTVTRVIDGDTIEVAGGTRVRFIGVDTPETQSGPNCFGAEATARTRELLPTGQRVRLVYDVERLDRFERTLAYVYRLPDGLFVNVALARDGFANQLTVPPNVARAEEFGAAVADARAAGRGLWASCPTTAVVRPTTAAPATTRATRPPTTGPPATAAPSGRCHASYAGACVPIASDVDCGGGSGNGPAYVYEKNFRVVGADVYGLDSDSDGIACESR